MVTASFFVSAWLTEAPITAPTRNGMIVPRLRANRRSCAWRALAPRDARARSGWSTAASGRARGAVAHAPGEGDRALRCRCPRRDAVRPRAARRSSFTSTAATARVSTTISAGTAMSSGIAAHSAAATAPPAAPMRGGGARGVLHQGVGERLAGEPVVVLDEGVEVADRDVRNGLDQQVGEQLAAGDGLGPRGAGAGADDVRDPDQGAALVGAADAVVAETLHQVGHLARLRVADRGCRRVGGERRRGRARDRRGRLA